jgi:hypothetical protein
MGVPVLRTLAFSVGFLAQLALVFAVFWKTLVCRTGTFGDAARIQAARQQPEDGAPSPSSRDAQNASDTLDGACLTSNDP